MNATTTQIIVAIVVIVILAALFATTVYYAEKKGQSDAGKTDAGKLADANNEVAAHVNADDAARSLHAVEY